MKRKIKRKIQSLIGHRILRKIERDQRFTYHGIDLEIPSGVFHPKYFSSSQFLIEWVENNTIEGQSIVEVGCGSGIASLLAARKGAKVTAIDISHQVIENLLHNARQNKVSLEILRSDLFDELAGRNFDYYLINPPFYPRLPEQEKEHAWFCGPEFEYFKKLFQQLSVRSEAAGIWMTLSNDCDLSRIQAIAKEYKFEFVLHRQKKRPFETNWLFELKRINQGG